MDDIEESKTIAAQPKPSSERHTAARKRGYHLLKNSASELEALCAAQACQLLFPLGCECLAAKIKLQVKCNECGCTGRVTARMLKHGNKGCACPTASFYGIDPAGPAMLIGQQLDFLGLTSQRLLEDFDSVFARAIKSRYCEIAAVSRFRSPRKHKEIALGDTTALVAELTARKDAGATKAQLYSRRKQLQAADGGSEALRELGLSFELRNEPSARHLAARFLGEFREDPSLSFHTFGLDYSSQHRGLPMVLVIAEYCRRRVPGRIVRYNLPVKWAMAKVGEARLKALRCLIRVAVRQAKHLNPNASASANILWEAGAGNLGASLSDAIDSIPREELLALVSTEVAERLSDDQLRQRFRERLLELEGVAYGTLQHGKRGISVEEELDYCTRDDIHTAVQLINSRGSRYKKLYRANLLGDFYNAAGWVLGYWAEIAHVFTRSLAEATAANLFASLGLAFVYNKMYREFATLVSPTMDLSGRQYRFDFFFPHARMFLELLLTEGERADKPSVIERSYATAWRGKSKFLFDCGLRPFITTLDISKSYGEPALHFARRLAALLVDTGLVDQIVSEGELRRACASVTSRTPDANCLLRELTNYLGQFCKSDRVLVAIVAALKRAVAEELSFAAVGKPLDDEVRLPFRDVTKYISFSQGMFVFRRTLKESTYQAAFPLRKAHWACAFLSCVRARDRSPIAQEPANVGSSIPASGVRYLLSDNVSAHALLPASEPDEKPRYRLFGPTNFVDPVLSALEAIAASRGELLVAPDIWPDRNPSLLQRHVVITEPSHAQICEVQRRVRARIAQAMTDGQRPTSLPLGPRPMGGGSTD